MNIKKKNANITIILIVIIAILMIVLVMGCVMTVKNGNNYSEFIKTQNSNNSQVKSNNNKTNINLNENSSITKEDLQSAFDVFTKSDATNDVNYNIVVDDSEIKIAADDTEYNLKYEIESDKIIFISEAHVYQGMSYNEYQKESEGITLPMLGFVAATYKYGVSPEDSMMYIAMQLLGGLQDVNLNDSYMIVDDTDTSEGVTIDKTEGDSKTIYASEFGDRVMEYVNSQYSNPQSLTDEIDNTFIWESVQKDVTDSSCTIESKLTVNLNSNFSNIKGTMN